MQVLCFAHRLEAQAFLNTYSYERLSNEVFKSPNHYLLICGEGIQQATEALALFLATHTDVTTVINLGTAAAKLAESSSVSGSQSDLDSGNNSGLELNRIYSIRSIYRQQVNEIAFKSFTSQDTEAKVDLVSSEFRIKDKETADYLYHFAPAIDREAWGLASVAKRLKKNFYAYKYISDDATKEACSQVKDIAENISYDLLKHYQNSIFTEEQAKTLLELPFRLTFTQKSEVEKILKSISLKEQISEEEILNSLDINEIKASYQGKEQSRELVRRLQKRLDPFTYRSIQKLNGIAQKHTSDKVQIHYDPSLESDQIRFQFEVSSFEELAKLSQELTTFPFETWKQILRGEDVE